MSHLVEIKTEVRDLDAVRAACRRLGLAEPVQETVELYSDQVTGLAVRLPGWRYPIVLDTAKAEARFDNFGGRWGRQQELDGFLQMYAVEKAKIESRKTGALGDRASPGRRLDQADDPSLRRRNMMRIIEIIVSPTGETKIETKGFAGSTCRDASRFIEEALGQRTGEQLTAEFHQHGTTGEQQRVGAG